MPVGRLSRGGLCDVIEHPAQRAGIDLDAGLVARMVEDTLADTGTGDPLPLLAFTLQQLYERRGSPTRITLADYEQVGGVVGALKEEANRTYERLQRQGLGDTVLPTLLQLAHVERERRPTGRSVKRARLGAHEIIDAFVEARLLTVEGDEGTIHVAHEALFSEWPLLRDEITRSQHELLARSQLEDDAREWEHSGRDPGCLVSGARLKAARKALAAAPDADATVAQFVAASKRRVTRQTLRSAFLGVIVLCVIAGAVLGARAWLDQRREAERKDHARAELVDLPSGGSLDEHEVTNRQYNLCVKQGKCPVAEYPRKNDPYALDRLPVVWVNAGQAIAFCTWIGRRLPTMNELDRAARTAGVRHLFRGWEWTSTPPKAGKTQQGQKRVPSLVILATGPGGTTQTTTAIRTHSEDSLGFRCAS